MATIKTKVYKQTTEIVEVTFELPCYRKVTGDYAFYKVISEDKVIRVWLSSESEVTLKDLPQLAFTESTEPSNKAEFDAAMQKALRKICDAYLIDIESKLNPNLNEQIETIFSHGNSNLADTAQEG